VITWMPTPRLGQDIRCRRWFSSLWGCGRCSHLHPPSPAVSFAPHTSGPVAAGTRGPCAELIDCIEDVGHRGALEAERGPDQGGDVIKDAVLLAGSLGLGHEMMARSYVGLLELSGSPLPSLCRIEGNLAAVGHEYMVSKHRGGRAPPDPVPARRKERAADGVCITSARADRRPGRSRNTRSNALPAPRQVGCTGARPSRGRGRRGSRVCLRFDAERSVPGGRARLRQRQHQTGQHDRGV
jgi:hypothetical protein